MEFRQIRGCTRPKWQQEAVYLAVTHLTWMPLTVREEAHRLVGQITANPQEGRALFEILTKDLSVEAAWQKFGVSKQRLYGMRREFYERFLKDTIRLR